ncbi:unnamed protein product, partial [Discosporangium mesarthrocarpum]
SIRTKAQQCVRVGSISVPACNIAEGTGSEEVLQNCAFQMDSFRVRTEGVSEDDMTAFKFIFNPTSGGTVGVASRSVMDVVHDRATSRVKACLGGIP